MSHQLRPRLTFGCVHYINALPFSLALAHHPSLHRVLAPPHQLLQMLSQRSVDVALTSSVGSLLPDHTWLPPFGIAAHRRVLSVNLYATSVFFSRPSRVAIPQESRSSSMLLRILSHHVWGQSNHQYIPFPSEEIPSLSPHHYDGLLLIGDLALQHPKLPSFESYDLAREWYSWTQLPFVFAALLTLETHPTSYHLLPYLEEALSRFEQDSKYRNSVLQVAHQHTQVSIPTLHEYFSLLQYRLTDEHYESLNLFRELATHVQENPHSEHV